MLKTVLQPTRLSDVKLAHISLALVGLMWVLPFVYYYHSLPLTTFDQELWSALLGALAFTLLVGRDFWRQPEIPRIVQLPAALIAVVWLQWWLGKIVYFDQAMLYVLYMLFAVLLMMLGAWLRDCFGMTKLALVLAIFLLVGAELNALIGVIQHYRWHTWLDSVIATKISPGVYGNIAQTNHFANYIALGLASLGLLYQQQRLKAGYVAVLALPLLLVMTLSGSRSSWLYLLMMGGLALWWAYRDAAQRPLLRYCLLLIVGFGVMHLVVQMSFISGVSSGSVNTVQRLLADSAAESPRLYLWREAVLMLIQFPWLGVGFGQFAWHHFQMLPVLQPGNIVGLYNNAHNLILQLAAEAGIAGLLALFVSVGVWLYGLYQRYAISSRTSPMENCQHCDGLDAAHWWGFAVLGVLAIHSMLEYPLWYTYFIAIAAILLGALDETRYRLKMRVAGRLSVVIILLLGLVALMQLHNGYRGLKQTLAIYPESSDDYASLARIRDGLIALHGGSLLWPYAELPLSGQITVNSEHLKEKLALNTRVMRFMPIGVVVYRQAMLLAQANQQEQAKSVMVQAIWSYPAEFADARRQMVDLAEKDSEHFSALLEFALQKEQEYRRAVHHQ